MARVKKVLNSSVVLAEDEHGHELILLGKGIGYGQKAGAVIPTDASDRTFIPMTNPETGNLVQLLGSIPAEIIGLTRDIVAHAEQQLGVGLHPHIYVALADHLNFAVERSRQGLVALNRLYWEIKSFYPQEFQIGQDALQRMRQRLDLQLPDEEAANIAFHLVNARKTGDVSANALRDARLIRDVVTIVTYTMECPTITESTHYSRFVSHMQYFAARFFEHKMLDSNDSFLFEQISTRYPGAMACAQKVHTHISTRYETPLPEEELAYLALHIQRVTTP